MTICVFMYNESNRGRKNARNIYQQFLKGGFVKRYVLIFGSFLMLSLLIMAAGYKYRTQYAKREIDTYYSNDQSYQLVIYNIGEPEWPFGPGKCRFVLKKEDKTIDTLDITVFNDGGWMNTDNFHVAWDSAHVSITVIAEEQEDTTYILHL